MDIRHILNKLDQITEATITKYPPGTFFIISDSQGGQKLQGLLNAQGINPNGPMEYADWSDELAQEVDAVVGNPKILPGQSYFAFTNQQGQLWVYNAGASTVGAALNHYHGEGGDKGGGKIANRGETAEGILGAAMFAKFTKREGTEDIGVVTVQDIVGVLDQMQSVGDDTYEVTVKDSDNKHADVITFVLRLKTNPYRDLMDPVKRKMLAKDFASAAGYVNSPMAERYSKYFYLNGRADEISVIADGAASETEKKPDVWVGVKDKDGSMRTLKLNTSLKVGGVKQFGQVGGSETKSMEKLWSYFGVDIADYVDEYEDASKTDQFAAISGMYEYAAGVIAQELAGDDDKEEAKFVDQIAHAVTYFATLGDTNVELVDFDKGGFKILRFSNLVRKMRDVDLTASFVSKKTRPEVSIHDVNDPKNELVKIRCKVENFPNRIYVRNIIEKGPLLEKITKVQQRAWTELETPDPAQVRVDLKPKAATAKVKALKKKSDPTANIGREMR